MRSRFLSKFESDEPDAVPRATRDRLFWTVCLPARTALGAGALAIGYARATHQPRGITIGTHM